jgi:glutamate dehydrogenase
MTPDKDGKFPEFYQTYVDEIIERVESNARNEFEFIWAEKARTGKRSIDLTLELSESMNDLFDVILASKLWEKETIRKNVLKEFFPKTLLSKVPYETLCERIPETFLKAVFAKYLGAQYFYEKGTNTNVYEFYEFVNKYDD